MTSIREIFIKLRYSIRKPFHLEVIRQRLAAAIFQVPKPAFGIDSPGLCLHSPIMIILFSWVLWSCSDPNEDKIDNFYTVEDIALPDGLTPEIGGLDFLPDGRLAAVFHRGEVMLYDPETKEWTLFAEGLHDPLGVQALSNAELLIMQRPELTRITDTDGDDKADTYMTVTDDFGMSGNYHEFAFGPAPDGEGNYFIALNCASSGAGIWDELRGAFNPNGRQGRMYSSVPYRGWVLKLTKEGELQPWASGFRSPDGVGLDLEGNLFVTDNQGDWLGTSKLYHVEKGKHYGQVSSLAWTAGWNEKYGVDPHTLPVETLDSMRTRAAVLFPHNLMSNSPTQPLVIPENVHFGPFAGQLLVGEMDYPRIMRVMLEEVKGEMQGACVSFMDSTGLSIGNHRMVFAPDGSLWVGSTAYVWKGDQGMQRIVFNGGTPMDVLRMNVQNNGFDLTFTRPVKQELAARADNYKFQRYYYKYHSDYGSPRMDEQPVGVRNVQISEDGKTVSLELDEMIPGYVYDLEIDTLASEKGARLDNRRIFYTLNNLPD
jgi:WD40 repeat protein